MRGPAGSRPRSLNPMALAAFRHNWRVPVSVSSRRAHMRRWLPAAADRARLIAVLTGHSLWRALVGITNGNDLTHAASIAYYALLSLFPFLLLVLSVIGSITTDDASRVKMLDFVLRYFPTRFDFVTTQIDMFRQTRLQIGAAGGLALIWASLGVFGAITSAV